MKSLLFLRDLQFGFLPDDCERDFAECFHRFSTDEDFASKCFKLALRSRNEVNSPSQLLHLRIVPLLQLRWNAFLQDLLKVLLSHLDLKRENYQSTNQKFIEPLILEAVELVIH